MAAKAEGAFSGAAGPDGPQIDADRRKDWDMENSQDALGEIFGLFKLQGNAAEPKVEDAGATTALVADDRVGVRSDHGDAFGFALNREGSLGLRCRRLPCQSPCCG